MKYQQRAKPRGGRRAQLSPAAAAHDAGEPFRLRCRICGTSTIRSGTLWRCRTSRMRDLPWSIPPGLEVGGDASGDERSRPRPPVTAAPAWAAARFAGAETASGTTRVVVEVQHHQAAALSATLHTVRLPQGPRRATSSRQCGPTATNRAVRSSSPSQATTTPPTSKSRRTELIDRRQRESAQRASVDESSRRCRRRPTEPLRSIPLVLAFVHDAGLNAVSVGVLPAA